jgi:hypothetical protein
MDGGGGRRYLSTAEKYATQFQKFSTTYTKK